MRLTRLVRTNEPVLWDVPQTQQGEPGRQGDKSDVVDLRSLWFILRRRLGLFFSIVGVIMTLAVLVTFQMPASYRAGASILIEPGQNEVGDVATALTGAAIGDAVALSGGQDLQAQRVGGGQLERGGVRGHAAACEGEDQGDGAAVGPARGWRAAGRIDVLLANGTFYGSWRAGWTNRCRGYGRPL